MILKKFSFPKKKRLVSSKEFKAVLARRIRADDKVLTLYIAENAGGWPRLGVSVGKSCGNAVIRNRLKRLMREVFRQNQEQIPAGFDYLLMVSRQSKFPDKLTFEQVQSSFLRLVDIAVAKIG